MSVPLVSVVIPAHNTERFIGETLESVFAQTFSDYEVVVVDDASTDNTRGVLAKYGDRIRLVTRAINSRTAGIPRYEGAECARGRYVAFLDADDLWDARKLEVQAAFMSDHPGVPLCHTYVRIVDEQSRPLFVRHLGAIPPTCRCTRWLLRHCFISTSSVMVLREHWLRAQQKHDLRMYGTEWDFFLAIARDHKVGFVPEALASYRWRPGSVSATNWRRVPRDIGAKRRILRKGLWKGIVPRREMVRVLEEAFAENARYCARNGQYHHAMYFCLTSLAHPSAGARLFAAGFRAFTRQPAPVLSGLLHPRAVHAPRQPPSGPRRAALFPAVRADVSPAPMVSVIVGTYNREVYVREAIESVLSQNFRDLEILVVDDASTDQTARVVSSYGDRVRLLALEEHVGLPGIVRNVALEAARGRFVAFLDSDDAWCPGKLEKQVQFMESHPDVPFSHTYSCVMDASSRVCHVRHEGNLPPTGDCFLRLLEHCFITTSTVMAQRSLFESVEGYFDPHPFFRIGEDYEFFLRVAQKFPVGLLNDVLGRYRRTDEGVSHTDWHYTPKAVPVHQWILDRPYRWQNKVQGSVVRKAFRRAALENSQYWYDLRFYSRSLYFAALACRHDAARWRPWVHLVRALAASVARRKGRSS
jgi:glycosyltransferase involved in cell wall biosynthesis